MSVFGGGKLFALFALFAALVLMFAEAAGDMRLDLGSWIQEKANKKICRIAFAQLYIKLNSRRLRADLPFSPAFIPPWFVAAAAGIVTD